MKRITNIDLAKLAAAGHSVSDIAESLGVTDSAITQALAMPEVQHLVAREVAASAAAKLDCRYDGLEDKLLGIMERRVSMEAPTMKFRDLTHTLNTINGMKRRTGGSQGEGLVQQVVNLTVPIQIVSKVVMSNQADICEIDGRPMVTVEPAAVNKLLELRDATRPKQISDLL